MPAALRGGGASTRLEREFSRHAPPLAAAPTGPEAAADVSPAHPRQTRDKIVALWARAGAATPQPKIAVCAERPPDGWEVLGVFPERGRGPFPRRKPHPPGRAVGDDVHGVEATPAAQRFSNLARRRA